MWWSQCIDCKGLIPRLLLKLSGNVIWSNTKRILFFDFDPEICFAPISVRVWSFQARNRVSKWNPFRASGNLIKIETQKVIHCKVRKKIKSYLIMGSAGFSEVSRLPTRWLVIPALKQSESSVYLVGGCGAHCCLLQYGHYKKSFFIPFEIVDVDRERWRSWLSMKCLSRWPGAFFPLGVTSELRILLLGALFLPQQERCPQTMWNEPLVPASSRLGLQN